MITFIIDCLIATLECIVILLTTSVMERDLLGGSDSRTSRDAAFTQCLEHKPRDYIIYRADGIARSGKRNRQDIRINPYSIFPRRSDCLRSGELKVKEMADVTGKEYLVEKQWKQADGVQNTCSYTISTFPHICIFTKDFDNELDQLISKYIEKHTSHGRST